MTYLSAICRPSRNSLQLSLVVDLDQALRLPRLRDIILIDIDVKLIANARIWRLHSADSWIRQRTYDDLGGLIRRRLVRRVLIHVSVFQLRLGADINVEEHRAMIFKMSFWRLIHLVHCDGIRLLLTLLLLIHRFSRHWCSCSNVEGLPRLVPMRFNGVLFVEQCIHDGRDPAVLCPVLAAAEEAVP